MEVSSTPICIQTLQLQSTLYISTIYIQPMSKYGVSYYKQKIGLPPHPALAKTSCKTIFS